MSRIGKKPIAIPKGVTVTIRRQVRFWCRGRRANWTLRFRRELGSSRKTGTWSRFARTIRSAAVHGLARALVNNAVEGVTKGWTRELEIVGIGYRAEMKGKDMVVFNLGYSHPIEYPLADGSRCRGGSEADEDYVDGNRSPEGGTGCSRNALACVRLIRTRIKACVTLASV